MVKFNEKLESLLKTQKTFLDEDKKLIKAKIIDGANDIDENLIELLISDEEIKKEFFSRIKDIYVFNINHFTNYIKDKNFLNNSYTNFANKIGIDIDKELLKASGKVSLVFPYKDCILEGGQTKDENKRNEIFFNSLLAKDEINKLLTPKVLTNFEYWDFEAIKNKKSKKFKGFNHNKGDNTISDNLLIKGNNLLAMHSIQKQFEKKIKLIYIDPPYNTKSNSNTFCYNNTFKHSSWLTFMKNRLEIAKKLLKNDGVLACAIDENEQIYLGALLKDIFNEAQYDIHCITIVHNPRGVQGTNFSYTHEYTFFVIPKNQKSIVNRKLDDSEIYWSNLRNWGGESDRTNAKNCFYPILIKNEKIIGFGDVLKDNKHPKQTEKKGDTYYVYPIDLNGVEKKWRYARQSVEKIRKFLRIKKKQERYDIEIGKNYGAYKSVWISPKYDANEYGTKIVKSLVPNCKFNFPKSLYNVYDCLYAVIGEDKNAIILDFFAGSGTTAHALLKMNKSDNGNRKFILIEQMDYIKDMPEARIKAIIEKEYKNESFVYMELATYNQNFIDKIQTVKSSDAILKLWEEMKTKGFLLYNIDIMKFDKNLDEFKKLELKEQQKILIETLNMNMLYVPLSESEDKNFNISKEDIELNKSFYQDEYITTEA